MGIEVITTKVTDEKATFKELYDLLPQLDFGRKEHLEQLAILLHKLSNNTEELFRVLADFILTPPDIKNPFTENTVVLKIFDNCSVRINIWLPESKIANLPMAKSELHAYDLPHDHNFSFMTVGLWGKGYETDVFSYGRSEIVGYQGEKVEVNNHGRKRLKKGDVHFYTEGKDIHIQRVPEEISISLNVLIDIEHKEKITEQYRFKQIDNNSLEIVRPESAATMGFLGSVQPFVNSLKVLAYSKIDEFLLQLTDSPNHYVRYDAYNNLLLSENSNHELLEEKIKRDPSPLINKIER